MVYRCVAEYTPSGIAISQPNNSANIESVGIYELLDEPAKAPPENRFGLLYDLNTPKISLYILSYFAGGTLTSAERQELINRGFISN